MNKISFPNTFVSFTYKGKQYSFRMKFSICLNFVSMGYLHQILAHECLSHALDNIYDIKCKKVYHIEDLYFGFITPKGVFMHLYCEKELYVSKK